MNNLLLVIDLQSNFVNDFTKTIPNKVRMLLESKRFDNVVFTKFLNDKNSQFYNVLNYKGCIEEWDREQGIVKLLSNKSDGCYVYFDLYNVVTITNVQATKTTNSVTLTVTIDAGENSVATYYFSIDGGRSYEESTSPNYTFSELTPNTT